MEVALLRPIVVLLSFMEKRGRRHSENRHVCFMCSLTISSSSQTNGQISDQDDKIEKVLSSPGNKGGHL